MKKAMSYAKEFFHRADIFLLVMGLICAIFGIVVISSATASYHSAKYVIVQSASLILGVFAFVVMTVLDVDVLADKLLERIPRPQLRVVGRAAGGPFRAAVRADPRRVV